MPAPLACRAWRSEQAHRQLPGEIDHIAARCEHVNPILLTREVKLFRYPQRIPGFLMPIQHLPQPTDFVFVGRATSARGICPFVTPMCTDTEFSLLVHFMSAYLHFKDFTLWPNHRRMQSSIAVFFGVGDIVIKLVGDVPP